MKYFLTFFLLLGSFLGTLQSQSLTKVEGDEKKQLMEKISASSKNLQTLKCSFVQEKKLSYLQDVDKSSGVMYFQTPSSLRWEYLHPSSYYFILSQSKITVKNSDGSISTNSASNRPIKMLSELIIGFISGKGLEENPNFKMEYYKDANRIMVKMYPESKEMKKMLKEVVLYLDNKTFLANEIVISENSGDTTRFIFSKTEVNTTLDNKIFNALQN